MTDHSKVPDDPLESYTDDNAHEDDDKDSVEVIFISRTARAKPDRQRDHYDLGWLSLLVVGGGPRDAPRVCPDRGRGEALKALMGDWIQEVDR